LALRSGFFHCCVHFYLEYAEAWMTAARLTNTPLIEKLNYSPCQ
jgi:hypothetical protein